MGVNGLAAPTARILIGGKECRGYSIRAVESETGVDLEAGCCTVELANVYDIKNSKFLCENDFVRGMKAEVQLGYITTCPVFWGFLYEITYQLGDDEEPVCILTLMDVKAAMMGGGVWHYSGGISYKQVIKDFFTGKHARGYSALCPAPDVELKELQQPVAYLPKQMDDYAFLCYTARRFGLECFVSEGKLLIRKKPASAEVLKTLVPGNGLERLSVRLRSAGYLASVTVRGGNDNERDGDKKVVSGVAKNSLKITEGSGDASRLIGKRKLELFEPSARDNQTAALLAESALRKSGQLSSELEMELPGAPELKPGFQIKLSKVSPLLNGDWYLTCVTHRMQENEFRTHVLARRDL